MLYVQKDLCAIVKAVFDHWDTRKDELNHQYLYAANARVAPRDIIASVNKRACPPLYLTCLFKNPPQLRERTPRTLPSSQRAYPTAISCSSYTTRWACTAIRLSRTKLWSD